MQTGFKDGVGLIVEDDEREHQATLSQPAVCTLQPLRQARALRWAARLAGMGWSGSLGIVEVGVDFRGRVDVDNGISWRGRSGVVGQSVGLCTGPVAEALHYQRVQTPKKILRTEPEVGSFRLAFVDTSTVYGISKGCDSSQESFTFEVVQELLDGAAGGRFGATSYGDADDRRDHSVICVGASVDDHCDRRPHGLEDCQQVVVHEPGQSWDQVLNCIDRQCAADCPAEVGIDRLELVSSQRRLGQPRCRVAADIRREAVRVERTDVVETEAFVGSVAGEVHDRADVAAAVVVGRRIRCGVGSVLVGPVVVHRVLFLLVGTYLTWAS